MIFHKAFYFLLIGLRTFSLKINKIQNIHLTFNKMVRNFFYKSKTAKVDSKSQISEKFMGVLRYEYTIFIVFNIPIHY